jgi:hypothetical protein
MHSISFAVVVPCQMTTLVGFVQAMNLFSGNFTSRRHVSSSHPMMDVCSSNPASALSLFCSSMSLCDGK